MFAPELTAHNRLAVAKSLSGNTVIALAQDCARHGDVPGLVALRDAGHFDLDVQRSIVPSRDWKIEHAQQLLNRALPMIDALLPAIEKKEVFKEHYAAPLEGKGAIATAEIQRVTSNAALWQFISSVCTATLDGLDQLFRDTPPSDVQDAVHGTRKETASVVAFLAAAGNDSRLYARAKECDPEAGRWMLQGSILAHVIGEESNLSRLSAQGVAVAMGSIDVLNEHVTGANIRQNMGKKRSGVDSEVATDIDYLMAASTGGLCNSSPRPEMVMWLLRASLDEEYVPDRTSTNGAKFETAKTLWARELFGGSWSHCAEQVMADHPVYIQDVRTNAFIFSVRTGMHTVATQLLEDWPTMKLAPVIEDKVQVWGEHPIKQVIPSRTHPGHIGDIGTPDIDTSLVFMFKHMQERAALAPFIDSQAGFFVDCPLVHALAQQNLNQSLVHLAELGMDLQARSNGKTAVEIIEFVESTKGSGGPSSDNEETLRLLRALVARSEAQSALASIANTHP